MIRGHFDCTKVPVQKLFAPSFHERAYDDKPGFRRFIEENGLPFPPHSEFSKAHLNARQALYQRLVERVWSPERLQQEMQS